MSVSGARIAVLLLAGVLAGCGADRSLPPVPSFDSLDFSDALPVIREQVEGVYAEWKIRPLDADLNGRLGMHLSVYRKSETAEILYRRARMLAPNEFRWTYYLAVTLTDLGRADDAIDMLRRALAIDPDQVEARIRLAGLLLQTGHDDESYRIYEAVTSEYPDRIEGWLGVGKILDRRGEHAAAVEALQRAVALGPQYGEVHYALSLAQRNAGDVEASTETLAAYQRTEGNRLRAADPLLLEVGALHVGDVAHMARARHFHRYADLDKAAASYRRAVEANPGRAEGWIGLVTVRAEQGDAAAAGEAYRQALEAGVDSARLHLAFGRALLDGRRLDAAAEILATGLARDTQDADMLEALGRTELLRGRYEIAAGLFERGLAQRDDDPGMRLLLGRALNGSERPAQAIGVLESLRDDQRAYRPEALRELALAHRGTGDIDTATDILRTARDLAWRASDVRLTDSIDALLADWENGSNPRR